MSNVEHTKISGDSSSSETETTSKNTPTAASKPPANKASVPATDPARFSGAGIEFKGKLIGVEDVAESRGDKMCQVAMAKLKAAVKAMGEHKQRITINISFDGLKLIDEKTTEILHTHEVQRVSFIARDMSDSRAFGYVYGSGQGKHQFFGIKTEKAAEGLVLALRDLFQAAYEMKKKQTEEKTSTDSEATDKPTEENKENAPTEGQAASAPPDLFSFDQELQKPNSPGFPGMSPTWMMVSEPWAAGAPQQAPVFSVFPGASGPYPPTVFFQTAPVPVTAPPAYFPPVPVRAPIMSTGGPFGVPPQGSAGGTFPPAWPAQVRPAVAPAAPTSVAWGPTASPAHGDPFQVSTTVSSLASVAPYAKSNGAVTVDPFSSVFGESPLMKPVSAASSGNPFAVSGTGESAAIDPFAELVSLRAHLPPGKKTDKTDFNPPAAPKPSLNDLGQHQRQQQQRDQLQPAAAIDPFGASPFTSAPLVPNNNDPFA